MDDKDSLATSFYKGLVASLVVVTMVLAGTQVTAQSPPFTDVSADHAFHDEIAWAEVHGIVAGYDDGTFGPTRTVTRQAGVAFLHRLWLAMGNTDPNPLPDPGFTDVAPGQPFYNDIAWAAALGITTGYSDGTFGPTRTVTRQAAAAFTHRLGRAVGGWFVVDTPLDALDIAPGDGSCDIGDGTCSLRAAIQESNASPTPDSIAIADGINPTLSVAGAEEDAGATGDLDVTGVMRIAGNGATVDAAGLDRAFDVVDPAGLVIEDLTITGGAVVGTAEVAGTTAGGGIRSAGRLSLKRVTVIGNAVSTSAVDGLAGGGGIVATRVDIEASVIRQNTASASPDSMGALGGGLWVTGEATVTDSEVSSNLVNGSSGVGGGILAADLIEPLDVIPLELSGSTIADNEIDTGGAGAAGGGGVFMDTGSITDTVIRGNELNDTVFGLGGGLTATGDLAVADSTIADNRGSAGGGVLVYWGNDGVGGHSEFTRVSITGNTADDTGGGLAVVSGPDGNVTATITESEITGNDAPEGGGIYAWYSPSISLRATTVSGNTARVEPGDFGSGVGGSLYLQDTTAKFEDTTITANTADDVGGGIYADDKSFITMTNSVFGPQFGGADCLIEDPTSVTSAGYNLDTDGTCGLGAPTDLSSTPSLLGPLADNGGPTLSHLPLIGSPLINMIPLGVNGCGTVADQRGVVRPQGPACDIGSIEQ